MLLAGCSGDADAETDTKTAGAPAAGDAADGANGADDSRSKPSSSTPDPEPRKPSGRLPSFRTIGPESGFNFERYDDMRGQWRIMEINGGGAALFDYDRDGRLDVFMTNGCRVPPEPGGGEFRGALFRNRPEIEWSPAGERRLFERVTGPSRLVQSGYTYGCAVGDYDADGFDDLYVTAFGRNTLWHNNGDGTFEDVTGKTGTEVPVFSSSAAFADLNGDGHLDLYVVNYLDESADSPRLCPEEASPSGYISCPPAQFEGLDDVLFLSDGAGGFRDATAEAGMEGLRGKGLGVLVADLQADGRPEIYVANDGEANFLFVRQDGPVDDTGLGDEAPPVRFEDRALLSGVALNEAGYAQASMGIAGGDYNADGTVDLFLTHFFNDTNTLYANRGGLSFEDTTRAGNLGPPSRRTLAWGTEFLDVDNDGWLDLFVANGHVDDRTWMEHSEPYRMRPQLFRNERDGTFTDVSTYSGPYFGEEWVGRGAAVGDLDRDGRADLVVSHQRAPSSLLHNETEVDNRSFVLQLVGTTSNRNGYGTRVEVLGAEVTTVRELAGGGSFHSASAPEVHLGLGNARTATLRIHWPSGAVTTHRDVPSGDWIVIEQQGLDDSILFRHVETGALTANQE